GRRRRAERRRRTGWCARRSTLRAGHRLFVLTAARRSDAQQPNRGTNQELSARIHVVPSHVRFVVRDCTGRPGSRIDQKGSEAKRGQRPKGVRGQKGSEAIELQSPLTPFGL